MSGKVYPLVGQQRDAVDPRECVWLSASAGTGKTQVLSARVLRLLLRPDTEPSQILCLTFTKAGAAEMATRVNAVLARWVRLPATALNAELRSLGAAGDPEMRDRARSLFASVLDTPGGGLRIETIHAFSQYLLGSFPEEAGLGPGAEPMEDRDRDLLARQVFARLVSGFEERGDRQKLATIADLSKRRGPDAVMAWLLRCAAHIELWTEPPQWVPPFRPRLARELGMPADADDGWVAEACGDTNFPVGAVQACLATLRNWNTATGRNAVAFLESWLGGDAMARATAIDGFYDTLLTRAGTPRSMKTPAKDDPAFEANQALVADGVGAVSERRRLLELLEEIGPALELGREFALAWDEAKRREGLIDFDDQIRRAAHLLQDSDIAAWIRYKLDRRFDHILVDEAQDTNADQWSIVHALIDDFFAGFGASGDKARTIFTVGDYKQAIFGFQGTSPENFREARDRVRLEMDEAADNANLSDGPATSRRLQTHDLEQSFRSAAPILAFVDRAVRAVGPENFGLRDKYSDHVGQNRDGVVGLWQPVTGPPEDDDREGEEDWLARHDRQMADRIADQVARWLSDGYILAKDAANPRLATPGDIMILVRKRRELAALIVARLHAKNVRVAGVDRLRIGNPLAVKDLMAALRFAVQPLDDLSLANLLVSPIIGWSQDDLLEYGYRPSGVHLWNHMKASDDPVVQATCDALRQMLARVDFDPPLGLLQWILTGPFAGRAKLVSRLGTEANDPIDELLNAAYAYGESHVVSLQGFIRWFDAGDGEIKREAGESGDAVRVMTVHGSKGLQAPIVVLADATGAPDMSGMLTLPEQAVTNARARQIPMPPLPKERIVGPLAERKAQADEAALQEHWRLMYVAMTRAEEALFIGGSLPPSAKGEPHPDSWYARLKTLFDEGDALDDPIWGARWEFGSRPRAAVEQDQPDHREAPVLPRWAVTPPPAEARPPRPLAPSSLGQAEAAEPPVTGQETIVAARRGVLLHRLFERLPDVSGDRRSLALAWLAKHGSDFEEAERNAMVASALSVIEDPRFAAVFSARSLAEVPFSAVVGGQVVQGAVDRLWFDADAVRVVDFKTAARPPSEIDDIPETTLRQMAAYHAAFGVLYPGRVIEIAVLYTHTPEIFVLPESLLARYKDAFANA